MSEKPLRDELRAAFEAMTRPAHPALSSQIRERLQASSPRRSFPLRLVAVAAIVLVFAVTAGVLVSDRLLGGTGRPAGVPTTPTLATPAPTSPPTAGPTPAPSGAPVVVTSPGAAGFTCATETGGGSGRAQVVGVRAAAQAGYDRFVIEFNGPVPQYEVLSQPNATFIQDASGQAVQLEGSSGVLVIVRNSSAYGTYAGPSDLHPRSAVLHEARQVGDFEGVVKWGLGLSQPACHRVSVLSGPSRLVVDVQA